MRTTIDDFLPAHLLQPNKPAAKPSTEKKKRVDTAAEKRIRIWKVTSQAVHPKLGKAELLILALFLMIAASAIVVSVQGLSRLMDSNALEQQIAASAVQSAGEK